MPKLADLGVAEIKLYYKDLDATSPDKPAGGIRRCAAQHKVEEGRVTKMSNTQIVGVLAHPGRHEVMVLWSDRTWSVVDFKPIIAEGGVFARLADETLFSRIAVIDRGEAIGWPGEIDFHADTLWAASHPASDIPNHAAHG